MDENDLPQFAFADDVTTRLDASPHYWDPATECTIVYARPSVERDLWSDYIDGAFRSYQQHGIGTAIDVDALRRGDDTALFAACVNQAGRVVGGLRAKGPYKSIDECHAIEEWADQPGEDAVRKMVADRLPFGVAEMKTAWVTDDVEESRRLTNAIARTRCTRWICSASSSSWRPRRRTCSSAGCPRVVCWPPRSRRPRTRTCDIRPGWRGGIG